MKTYLLPSGGNFYKANLHCHTNISDGAMSPEEVKKHYKAMGYSAVCYTDHEVLIGHKDLCDDEFIALHGYEAAIKQDPTKHTSYFMPVYHFNMIAEKQDNLVMPRCYVDNPSMPGNARSWFEKNLPYDKNDVIDHTEYSIEWLNEYLPKIADKGFLITYNHPQWSMQNSNDYLGLRGLHAIEVINGGCIGIGDCTSVHFEQMLRNGMEVIPVAGDDNHSRNDCCVAWTVIKAEELTYDALIKAYKNGDCYSSNGPQINDLYIEDDKVVVNCSKARQIILRGEGRYREEKRNTDHAEFIYTPAKIGKFFRIEIIDEDNKVAFSRAYKTADINL